MMATPRSQSHLLAVKAQLAAGEAVAPADLEGVVKAFDTLERRVQKISHISDGYQAQLLNLNRELSEANQKLAQALAEVKTLRGFIPICAQCKRVRDDQGYWDQVETYISRRSEAVFSHGICPECANEMRKELVRSPKRRVREPDLAWHERLEARLLDPDLLQNPLRADLLDLLKRHDRLQSRFDKITRISDGFQSQLKELNQALAESSRTDALTGLANRRSMMERLKVEWTRSERAEAPLSVIMADVDFFKEINDSHGHDAGDQALKGLAEVLRESLREYDFCARWGGEEFLFLLPASDAAAAQSVGTRIQQQLAATTPLVEGLDLQVTLSLGIAERRQGESLTSLLGRADSALYEAKRRGRNRISLAP